MSFIKDTNKDASMAKSDIILILVFVIGGLGLWWFTSTSKSESFQAFDDAQILIDEKKYEEAYDVWFELQNIGYKTDSLDSILYENLSYLEEIKTNNLEGYRAIKKILEDSIPNEVKIQQRLQVMTLPYFFKDDQLQAVKGWQEKFTAPDTLVNSGTNDIDSLESNSKK